MLHALGLLVARRARWFLLAWAVVSVVGFLAVGGRLGNEGLFDRLKSEDAPQVAGEAKTGLDLLAAASPTGTTVQLLLAGVDPAAPATYDAVLAAASDVRRMNHVATVAHPYLGPGGQILPVAATVQAVATSPFVGLDRRSVLVAVTLDAGLTAAQVAGQVRSALVGSLVTRIQLADGGPIDLYVQLDPARVTSVDSLKALPVGLGTKVALGSVADVSQVATQGSITRIDQAPSASITADVTGKDTGGASTAAQATVNKLKAAGSIPAGVDVRFSGVTQQQGQAFGGLFNSMAIAMLLVYVMMVLAFNSLITPFVIMFSLPLAAIGVFPALLLTDRAIGISALIGILMLIGIVVTNAIVLLDLVERLRRQGMSTTEALVEGGKTRVRPILMTAIATILALIPLAAGLNQGSIIAAELGTVVIGGLFSSTFLTLIVVPVVYSLVDGAKNRLGARGGARLPKSEAA